MKLYSYWRSSTSYRVRAALNLKQLEYELVPIDLLAGDQRSESYLAVNPSAGVPTLELDDGTHIAQSMVILDYVDTIWPEPNLIPTDSTERARQMAVAHAVALDIHPVNNSRVIGQLKERFGASPEDAHGWMQHWMALGFEAVETLLPDGTRFAFGDQPGIADLCIVAQVYNAHRWGLDLAPFPKIARIEQHCLELPEIHKAHPDQQPEAQEFS